MNRQSPVKIYKSKFLNIPNQLRLESNIKWVTSNNTFLISSKYSIKNLKNVKFKSYLDTKKMMKPETSLAKV